MAKTVIPINNNLTKVNMFDCYGTTISIIELEILTKQWEQKKLYKNIRG